MKIKRDRKYKHPAWCCLPTSYAEGLGSASSGGFPVAAAPELGLTASAGFSSQPTTLQRLERKTQALSKGPQAISTMACHFHFEQTNWHVLA